jgi:hypothetical protein
LSRLKSKSTIKVVLHCARKQQFQKRKKLNIETTEMSKVNIKEILLSKEANAEIVNDFIALTENCEIAGGIKPSSSATIQKI